MSNNPRAFFPTPELMEQLKDEWENGDLSAEKIAEKFGTTRNTIIGLARRNWEPRIELEGPQRTLFTRLDAIHAKFDAAVK